MSGIIDTRAVTDALAHVVPIDPVDNVAIESVARGLLPVEDGRIDDPAWVAAAREGWDQLPVALRRGIREFRRDSGQRGALLVRNLPVAPDELPDTPSAAGSVQRTSTIPAAVLLMVANGLGDPAAFHAEKSGALVQDVVPVPGKEEFQGNAGSVLLSFHNENAFHQHRPDYVMLLCLRSDPEGLAGLRTSCIRDVLPLLSNEAREALRSSEFVTAAPPSFGAGEKNTPPAPILFGAPEDPDVRVDFAATKPLTERATAAMNELQALFAEHAQTIYLQPGDLAIVDNRVAVHGRTAFNPRYDGADRWLQRTFALTDLRRSRDFRPGDGYVLNR